VETLPFSFAASRFVPVAIGFFGLGTGYLIWGGQCLIGFTRPSLAVDKTMGMWGFWMPGLCNSSLVSTFSLD
jgi:hypothetical protein